MLTQVNFAVRRCCSHTAWACSACMIYELWKRQEQCNNAVPKLRRNIRTESHQQHTAIIHSATGSSGHHTLKALYKRRKRESITFCLYTSHSRVCTHAHTHTHTQTPVSYTKLRSHKTDPKLECTVMRKKIYYMRQLD